MQNLIIIAIDGPAASGKSSVAKYLADQLGYLYVDTGAMYRAITNYVIEQGIVDDEEAVIEAAKNISIDLEYSNGVTKVFVDGEEVTDKIRTPKVNSRVSDVSKIKGVREQLVKLQRKLGDNKNLIVEGRDTTTVVFPNAALKIFLTADVKERARRRHKEFTEKGVDITLEEVEKSISNRDTIDSGREVSPLKKADDAFELDTTSLTIDQEIQQIIKKVKEISEN